MRALTLKLLECLGECLLDLLAPTQARHPEEEREIGMKSSTQMQVRMQAQVMLGTPGMQVRHGTEDAEVGEREAGHQLRSRNELPQLPVCLEPCRTEQVIRSRQLE